LKEEILGSFGVTAACGHSASVRSNPQEILMKAVTSKSNKQRVGRPEPLCLYSVAAVAEQCDTSDKTIRRLIEKGKLRCVRVGRSVRVSHAELVAHLNRTHGAGPLS
jgi:excisionase family DNA binding protein